ncbi:phosphoglycerate mutase-like protein [Pluteus cervinus]|uniref:Phosphoglycerate mutase-like protein n=1 Tax=Pluteus cervinus TaxID=181527 RepID=A0ACD3BG99_9AGAR|nr:phosphoglycerate mutase-like protein [Pluteus cervinus]
MSRPVPRVFLIRHGETEWSLNGRHTGRTDIPLTPRGVEQVKQVAKVLVGPGKLIDPSNLCTVFVSPRQRAHKTFHLLFEHSAELPHHILTEDAREWDYGDYEGLLSSEIKKSDPSWTIWTNGCPGGESVEEMQDRVDDVISQVVRKYHREYYEEGKNTRDVMIVAHGHFTRVFITRWVNLPLANGTLLNAEPVGVAVLSYNHKSLDEPCLNALNISAAIN